MTSVRRRSDGCWTCRIRRKRCDERQPVCRVCQALHIDCVYSQQKPDWMDGGTKQKRMMEEIKAKVKANASHRRERHVLEGPNEAFIIILESDFRAANRSPAIVNKTALPSECGHDVDGRDEMEIEDATMTPSEGSSVPTLRQAPETTPDSETLQRDMASLSSTPFTSRMEEELEETVPLPPEKPEVMAFPPSNPELSSLNLGREAETEFVMMYLDFVFPFLFPFYRPPMLEAGRHWLLNLIRINKVAFHTAVSLSSYFFTIVLGDTNPTQRRSCRTLIWGQLARQTTLALKTIQADMEDITRRGVGTDLVDAARIMGSIIQQLIVEVTIKRSVDWSLHLNPTLALFQDIFANHGIVSGLPDFYHLLNEMPPPPLGMVGTKPVPRTADRTAFTFFTSVLLYMDIIASTATTTVPQLSQYHTHLLLPSTDSNDPPIRLETTLGIQNFVLHALASITTLAAWKKSSKASQTLSVLDLVSRATPIYTDLELGLARLEAGSASSEPPFGITPEGHIKGYYARLENRTSDHAAIATVTRIWALAARIYLSVVVSGWQPANASVRADVSAALELLVGIESPGQIRALAWPLCVVGCLATAEQEDGIRSVVDKMGDLREFGTVGQVLRIADAVWMNREGVDRDSWDVAACLNVLGSPALLI